MKQDIDKTINLDKCSTSTQNSNSDPDRTETELFCYWVRKAHETFRSSSINPD